MVYEQSVTTPSYLCDVDDRLHVWAAIRLCQEVTEYHGNETGIGFKTLLAQNHAWVITQAFYQFHRLPLAFEKITLQTWSRGNNGLFAYRDYRILSGNGELLLTGTSSWTLIDLSSRHVVRLGNVVTDYPVHNEMATDYEVLPKMKLDMPDSLPQGMERQVCYAMLDHTRHVNNSEYVRMIFDHLHIVGFHSDIPFSLMLKYSHESRLGDVLSLFHQQSASSHILKIANSRGECVLSKIEC